MLAQQLSVKLFADDPAAVQLAGFIPVFHGWIQESRLPGRLLIDVADYRHVANGPGVVLIAHEARYALDGEHGPLGLECVRQRDEPGPLEEKLVDGFRDALAACRHLEEDPTRPIRFRTDRARVAILSRRFASGGPEAWDAARPAFEAFAARLYAGLAVRFEPSTDLRAPFAV
ncbi:MAG TPA: hypothetical protein VEL05_05980, partial [Candidatus Acidoferrum sp.]|nr:hypothetical protein [Candidatus Acidoferrum sp.]